MCHWNKTGFSYTAPKMKRVLTTNIDSKRRHAHTEMLKNKIGNSKTKNKIQYGKLKDDKLMLFELFLVFTLEMTYA